MVDTKQFYNIPPAYWALEGSQLIACILINAVCLWHVLFRLKINVYISRILCMAVSGTLVCQAVNFASLALINLLKTLNVRWCSMMVIPKVINGLITSHFTMAIAVVRYYLASKTAKVEMPNQSKIQQFIMFLCGLIIGYTAILAFILTLSDTVVLSPLIAVCAGQSPGIHPTMAIMMMPAHVSVIIGLVNDSAMAIFLRNRRRVAPLEMSVWTLEAPIISRPKHQEREQESKLTIPIKATVIGGCLLLLVLIMFAVATKSLQNGGLSNASMVLIVFVLFLYQIYMPLIVAVTIKSNEKRLKKAVAPIHPPRELQFHE